MKNNTKTIALDWLQMTFFGRIIWNENEKLLKLKHNLFLEDLQHGSKHFKRCATVIFNGENIGNIQFEPRNAAIMDLSTVIFKAENRILYQKGYMNKILDFSEIARLKYKHITKLDIALDSEQVGRGVFDFFKKLQQGKIRAMGSAAHNFRTDSENRMKYFRKGESTSNKLVRCYYKKAEIEVSQKHYITEFWQQNKLDITKEIERVEISMKKKELYKYHVFKDVEDLLYLESTEFLASLFQSGCKGFFEFVTKKEYEKHNKQANRCKKISFFSLKNLGGELLQKMKSKITTDIFRLKQFAKTCYFIGKQTKSELYATASREVAANIRLSSWYEKSIERWDYEFNLFKRSGRFDFITKFNTLQTNRQEFNAIIMNAYN